MASIKAILKINEQGNGVITSVTSNYDTNNVSALPKTNNLTSWFLEQTSEYKSINNTRAWGLVGIRKYGQSVYGISNRQIQYLESYSGLMFGYPVVSGNDNIYNLTLTIVGTDIIAFNLYFDGMNNNQYPLEYSVYSSITGTTTTYTSDSRVISISGLTSGSGITRITFSKWNVANVPVAITFFENVELQLELNKQWIQEFETQSQSTSDPSKIEYSALANTGSISLIDRNNTLYEYSKLGYLNMNLFTLYLYVNNKLLQEHISTTNPFYSQNQKLKLELSNDLSNWNNTNIAETAYSSTIRMYGFLTTILNKVRTYTSAEIDAMLTNKIIDVDNSEVSIETYFRDMYISPFTLQSGSVLEALNKICETAQLNCLFDDSGNLKFYSARPIKFSDEKVIVIPFEKQFSVLNYSILTDNRYDTVVYEDTDSTSNKNNYVKINTNEILDKAYFITYDEEEQQIIVNQKNLIKQNILADYQYGIKKAEISIFPSDYYYDNGTIAKTWKNGDLIEINDIVKIEREVVNKITGETEIVNTLYDRNGQDVYFRVVDRKVRYKGQVLIDLVLREIKN